eukprot:SAG11_NODE_31862_length_288_cov_1.089947_1_plen_34_part_01
MVLATQVWTKDNAFSLPVSGPQDAALELRVRSPC